MAQHDTQAIKQGENMLQHLKKNNQYPLGLLHYIDNPNTPDDSKLRAACELKLWCEYFKVPTP